MSNLTIKYSEDKNYGGISSKEYGCEAVIGGIRQSFILIFTWKHVNGLWCYLIKSRCDRINNSKMSYNNKKINMETKMFSEWDKGITKESFELRLKCNDIQRFVYTMIDMKFTLYLIDRQKREVVKIINREITNFFYHKVYMAQMILQK